MNSPRTPVAGLTAHRRAIVAHFVVRLKISHKAIWDFFNSIGQNRKYSRRADVFRFAPESGHALRVPKRAWSRRGCALRAAFEP